MNAVVSDARLFRQLALTPIVWFQVGFCLFATYFSTVAEGWTRWGYPLFLLFYLMSVGVEWQNYRAVGMTRAHWRRHRRILVSALVGLVLVEMILLAAVVDLPVNPMLPTAVLAAWVWALVRRPEPSRGLEGIVEGSAAVERSEAEGTTPDRSRFPLTPVQQIIRGPQVTMWLLAWGMIALAVLVLGALTWLFNEPPEWASVVFPLVGIPAMWMIMGKIGDSLREWVSFGGERGAWARETALIGLLSPLLAGLGVVMIGGTSGNDSAFEGLPFILGIAFLIPVLFTLVELSDQGRTWWVSLPYAGMGAGLFVLRMTGSAGEWTFFAGCVVLYLLHAFTLPTVARNYTVFGGGLRAWLGLRPEAKV